MKLLIACIALLLATCAVAHADDWGYDEAKPVHHAKSGKKDQAQKDAAAKDASAAAAADQQAAAPDSSASANADATPQPSSDQAKPAKHAKKLGRKGKAAKSKAASSEQQPIGAYFGNGEQFREKGLPPLSAEEQASMSDKPDLLLVAPPVGEGLAPSRSHAIGMAGNVGSTDPPAGAADARVQDSTQENTVQAEPPLPPETPARSAILGPRHRQPSAPISPPADAVEEALTATPAKPQTSGVVAAPASEKAAVEDAVTPSAVETEAAHSSADSNGTTPSPSVSEATPVVASDGSTQELPLTGLPPFGTAATTPTDAAPPEDPVPPATAPAPVPAQPADAPASATVTGWAKPSVIGDPAGPLADYKNYPAGKGSKHRRAGKSKAKDKPAKRDEQADGNTGERQSTTTRITDAN